MSPRTRPTEPTRMPPTRQQIVLRYAVILVIFVLGASLFLQNNLIYFMNDDEGGYAYAAWRISEGEMPYRDFLTPQMPIFLYWGGLVVRLFGPSFASLRVATTLMMLEAAYLSYRINRELLGESIAVLSVPILLAQNNIFHNARYYRPEAPMLVFALGGVYAFVLAEKRGQRSYLGLASVLFALSMLSKLFGALLWAGCFLWILYAWLYERRPFWGVVRQAVTLALPGLLLLGLATALLSWAAPPFLSATLLHHTMQGAGMAWMERLRKMLSFYELSAQHHHIALLAAAVGVVVLFRRGSTLATVLFWQFPTLLGFALLSRQLYPRHITYLAPALSALAATGIWWLWQTPLWNRLLGAGQRRLWRRALPTIAALVLCLAMVRLWAIRNGMESEGLDKDTPRVAALVREMTSPDDAVIADYLEINFAAGRRSTYWAAGLSEGATKSGQIDAARLIEDIEHYDVRMVVLHAFRGTFHLVEMADYYDLRSYLHEHFYLIDRVTRGEQLLEIYHRQDTMPYKPRISYHDELMLTGARIVTAVVESGDMLTLTLRWQALQKMARDYHLSLMLVDDEGHIWTEYRGQLKEETVRSYVIDDVSYYELPTSHWDPPRTVWQDLSLPIRPGTPPGVYHLVARVREPYSGLVLPARAGAAQTSPLGEPVIATITVSAPYTPAALDTLDIPVPIAQQVAPGLELLGVSDVPQDITLGRELDLELFWRAVQHPVEEHEISLRLVQGTMVRQRWLLETVYGYPTTEWREGETVIGHYRLRLADGLPTGAYTLDLVTDTNEANVVLASLRVNARMDAERALAQLQHALPEIRFSERIQLLGYDLEESIGEGDEWVHLTLYWSCSEPLSRDYMVFTHLLDEASQIQGQRDAIPGGGNAPTLSWQPGDIIVDRYEIPIGPDATPGELRIAVGLYDPFSNERLPLAGNNDLAGQDVVILPSVITLH